jgi:plastocyanin
MAHPTPPAAPDGDTLLEDLHMRSRGLTVALGAVALSALVLAVACGGSSLSTTTPTPPPPSNGGAAADVTITIVGMNGAQSYSPNPGSVRAGQTVAWHNADSTSHTATANSGAFDTGIIPPGATSAPIAMPAAGTFAYHCSIHPTMTGTLSVQ